MKSNKNQFARMVNRCLGILPLACMAAALFIVPARLFADSTAPDAITGMLGSGLIWTSDEEGNMSAISNGATSYSYGYGGLAGYWKFDEGSGAMLSQNFMERCGEI